MENYIQSMIDYLQEAQDELRPRVIDGEGGPLEACAEKIGEALTAVNYWQWTVENGGTVLPTDIEETQEVLHDAQDSVKEYLDSTGWKDNRAYDAFTALGQAIDSTENYMENQEA